MSQSFSVGSTIEPIGTCQGLNSSHSPRIVTSISIGKRQARISDSMLTQLPTPLDCISSAERWPPSQAPAASAMPSSSVVSATSRMSGIGLAARDQPRMAGVGHVADLADVGALEHLEQLVLPGLRLAV